MSLLVSFRHEARAEFIEAAAWYEARQTNLGIDFIAVVIAALFSPRNSRYFPPLFITTFVVLSLSGFLIASTTALRLTALWFSQSFMPSAIHPSGSTDPSPALDRMAAASPTPDLMRWNNRPRPDCKRRASACQN